MKTRTKIIIPIIAVVAIVVFFQTWITVDCLAEDDSPGFLECVWIFVNFVVPQAFAEPTTLKLDDFASELWYDHEFIIDGMILDIRGYGQQERVYDIQINSFFKPAEEAGPKVITVYGSPNFYNVKGDRGIFFIKKDDARWTFGEYGTKITGECLPELMYHNPSLIDPPLTRGMHPIDYSLLVDCYPHYYKKYLPQYMKARGATEFPSPLAQQRDRVLPNEVVCNEGLELIMKNNGRASCVKPSTIEKLLERKWAKPIPSMFRDEPNNSEEYLELPLCDPIPKQDFSKCLELPQHAMNPDTFLLVIDKGFKSQMELELTSMDAYEDWQKSRGPAAKKVPILNVRDHNTHPLVLQMVNSMWDFEGYLPSKYNDKLYVKEIDLDSTEIEHKSIYDWLDKIHTEQFGETEDASFSNHFTFRQNLYKLSWAVAD